MANTEPAARVFVRKVGNETKVRVVTSPGAAVGAKFDGYTELTGQAAKKALAAAERDSNTTTTTSGSGSDAANNAG